MEVVERKRSRGGFLNLFDWPGKSRKKLFSSTTSSESCLEEVQACMVVVSMEEDGFTLVNLHMNQTAYLKDPFILPSQAKQVFYSREDDDSNWYVVMRAPPRGYHELETEDLGGAPLPVQEVNDLDDEAFDDDSVYVRDDCEGLLVVD